MVLLKENVMKAQHPILLTALFTGGLLIGCSDYRRTGQADAQADGQTVYAMPRESLEAGAENTIERFTQRDPTLERFFETAVGWAVFPEITKGGVGIGGAHGEGVMYEDGRVIGDVTLSQVTVGAQLGGQTFRQIIFFSDRESLLRLTEGRMEFSAQASAVAAAEGAARSADYREGVAVFTMPTGGLMFEAAIGGQQFNFTPRE